MARGRSIWKLLAPGAVVLAGIVAAQAADRPDLMVADFEGATYGGWTVEGEAFGTGPARGTLPGQMSVSGYQGSGLVNSFRGGDATTGRLTSPPFQIERRFLNLLVGGGKDEERLAARLVLDGRPVRTATGPNDRPGGTERLEWRTWEVAELEGRTVRIEIVDAATGGWGHLNVDEIVQSDRRQEVLLREAARTLRLDRRYLCLPVRTGAPKRRMALAVAGRTVREWEIELAEDEPQFWVFLELAPFRGQEGTLRVDRLPEGSPALDAVVVADTVPGTEDLYREKLRPQFHFTSRRGWLNDPNGLVYDRGEYHLYYQHNPYGWDWGNMHWGHAVSRDLVHWEELPIAVYPREFGDWAFSGSAVVDRENTSGFGKDGEPPLVAAYTSTGRGECLLYSTDRGRTFTEYAGNPVFKHDGRDPKLIWYAPGKHWVMAVYDVRDKKDGILFLTSPDLKTWTPQTWIGGYFECPELFELPVDGDPENTRWVLHAADGAYALGRFDGRLFTVESGKHRGAWGEAFYASQTFNDLPARDGRRIRIGWGRVPLPGMAFNQMMNFPVELSLRTTDEGIRLFARPVRELERLRARKHALPAGPLAPGTDPLAGLVGELWDLRAELDPGTATSITLKVRGIPIVYDAARGTLTCQGQTAPLKPENGRIRLQVLADRASLEIFGNDGRVYMPIAVIPAEGERGLELTPSGGTARVVRLTADELRSIWR